MNRLSYLLLSLTVAPLLLSCHSEDSQILPSISETKTFSGSSLGVTYMGETMPGKSCRFTPGTAANTAVLTLYGELTLSQLDSSLTGSIPVQGIFPGEAEIDIPVSLIPDGDAYSFTAAGDAANCSYSLSGRLLENQLDVDISDVVLSDTSLAGTVLSPTPLVVNNESVSSTPFHLKWNVSLPEIGTLDLTPLLVDLVTLDVVPVNNNTSKVSLSKLVESSLSTAALRADGNIVFRYISASNGAAQIYTSTANAVQYYIAAPGTLVININPLIAYARWLVIQSGQHIVENVEFVSSARKSVRLADSTISPIIISIAKEFIPLLSTGVPFSYEKTATRFEAYLNTQECLWVLQKALQGVEATQQFQQLLADLISTHPEIVELLPDAEKLLADIPAFLEATTVFELGFSYNILPMM